MAKYLTGLVTSTKNDKTITVKTEFVKNHPIYKKKFRVSKKYLVHDEKNTSNVGDTVRIMECRPLSANKHFTLDKIVKKANITEKDQVDKLTIDPEIAAKPVKTTKKLSSDKEEK